MATFLLFVLICYRKGINKKIFVYYMDRFILITNEDDDKSSSIVAASLYRLLDKTTNYNLRLIQISLKDMIIDECEDEVFVLKDGFVTNAGFGIYERITGREFTSNNFINVQALIDDNVCQCNSLCNNVCSRLQKLLLKKNAKSVKEETIVIVDILGKDCSENYSIFNKTMRNMLEHGNNLAILLETKETYDGNTLIIQKEYNYLIDALKMVIKNKAHINDNNGYINNVYQVPSLIYETIYETIISSLDLEIINKFYDDMESIYTIYDTIVCVSLITDSEIPYEAHRSLIDSVVVAGAQQKINIEFEFISPKRIEENDPSEWYKMVSSRGIIMPGGYGSDGLDGKLNIISVARKNNIPFLGICLGFQLSLIEYCRNVLNLDGATSEEFNQKSGVKVIQLLRNVNGEGCGPRHGDKITFVGKSDKIPAELVSEKYMIERFRHSYGFPTNIASIFESSAMKLTRKTNNKRYYVGFEHKTHPFFVGLQCHPEFTTRYDNNRTVFTAFLRSVINRIIKTDDI